MAGLEKSARDVMDDPVMKRISKAFLWNAIGGLALAFVVGDDVEDDHDQEHGEDADRDVADACPFATRARRLVARGKKVDWPHTTPPSARPAATV